jgi:acyl-CoA thioester hydrolase
VRIARLGNKSLASEYRIEDAADGREFASGAGVLVAYDYQAGQTVPVPEMWREKITEFEGLTQDR